MKLKTRSNPQRLKKFESDETSYAKAAVGGTENLKPLEQKVFSRKWNYKSDERLLTLTNLLS